MSPQQRGATKPGRRLHHLMCLYGRGTRSGQVLLYENRIGFRSHIRDPGSPGPAARTQNHVAPDKTRNVAPPKANTAANFSYKRTESGFALVGETNVRFGSRIEEFDVRGSTPDPAPTRMSLKAQMRTPYVAEAAFRLREKMDVGRADEQDNAVVGDSIRRATLAYITRLCSYHQRSQPTPMYSLPAPTRNVPTIRVRGICAADSSGRGRGFCAACLAMAILLGVPPRGPC